MADSDQELRTLLAEPREALDLELKQWIDPALPEGIAKIARAGIALRNNNGGRLVIGFTDDGKPDTANVPADVRATYHVDVIQGIVSRYSAEQFAVDVRFVDVNGQAYPVITVPSGVRTPVASKATLNDSNGRPLIRDHAVYVRSVQSNNTVSTTEARRGDWESLTRICFDNREADIGGFVRRHLAAINLESLAALVPAFAGMLRQPTTTERVTEELNRGRSRFDAEIAQRRLQLPSLGYREAVILIDGAFPNQTAGEAFRRSLTSRAPRHTGWSPWVDLSGASEEGLRPYVVDHGWEALILGGIFGAHLDFWRMEPRGAFYHLRGLEDDLAGERGPQPRTQLDFMLQVARTAEIISTGLSFGRSLGCDEATTTLVLGFRWTGLAGRRLSSWVEPHRYFRTTGPARQDQITTTVAAPLETPPAGVAPHVENVVRDLFLLFDGLQFESQVIQQIVSDTIERRY